MLRTEDPENVTEIMFVPILSWDVVGFDFYLIGSTCEEFHGRHVLRIKNSLPSTINQHPLASLTTLNTKTNQLDILQNQRKIEKNKKEEFVRIKTRRMFYCLMCSIKRCVHTVSSFSLRFFCKVDN